jgi:hypothetical protein
VIKLKSKLNLAELRAKLDALPKVVDGTGVLMANGQFNMLPDAWDDCIKAAVREIEDLLKSTALYVMVNTIEPGRSTIVHVDPLPPEGTLSRWHLPVQTNEHAWFSHVDKSEHLEAGYWHGPICFWEPHAVGNAGSEPRTHLIVDLL